MKTRFVLIGAAMTAALNCAAVNAQVLGGVGGGLGGALSGGMRDMSMATRGTLNGSFGADLDTGSLRRTTRDTAGRVTNRVQNTTSNVRDRAAGKVGDARDKVGQTRQAAAATTSAAAATAMGAVNDVQIDGAADIAGSAASNVSNDGANLAGTAHGAGSGTLNGATLPASELPNVEPANLGAGETANVSNAARQISQPAKNGESTEASSASGLLDESNGAAHSGLLSASSATSATQSSNASSGLLDGSKDTEAAAPSQTERAGNRMQPLDFLGGGSGTATASRDGVSAQGNGSLRASRN